MVWKEKRRESWKTFEDVAESEVGIESEVFALNSTDRQNIIAVWKWKGGRKKGK